MSNDTDTPNPRVSILTSVVRATAMVRKIWEEDQLRDMAADHPGGEQPHQEPWRIFARESGMTELVEAVEDLENYMQSFPLPCAVHGSTEHTIIEANKQAGWHRVVAAARRVMEG